MNSVVRSALLGAATGSRSATGIAALAVTASGDAASQPDKTLGIRRVKGLITLAAASEWALDKLPNAPSRLEPAGFVFRLIASAGAGVIITRRVADPAAMLLNCSAAVAAGAGTSWLGSQWRAWAAARIGTDYVGAGIEDAVALALASAGARSR